MGLAVGAVLSAPVRILKLKSWHQEYMSQSLELASNLDPANPFIETMKAWESEGSYLRNFG